MLHAELHGKIAPEATDSERREDVLTSTVFGVLFAASAWTTVLDWFMKARGINGAGVLNLSTSSRPLYWFWPRLDNAEPDLVVRVENHLIVVEAKFHSGKSGKDKVVVPAVVETQEAVKDQLVREWRACSPLAAISSYPEPIRDAVESCERTLIYLVQRSRLARERRAVEASLKQEPKARILLLTWEDLDEVLAATVGEARWTSELRQYLQRKRLSAFRGFQSATYGTTAGLQTWRYAPPSHVRFPDAFAASELSSLQRLCAWPGNKDQAQLGWASAMNAAALQGLSQLASRSGRLTAGRNT